MTDDPAQIDIVIVGAGLAGLAAAISTALSGHKVTVVESAQELKEVGAGLQCTPNSTRILQAWNLSPSLWTSACEPTSLTVHRYTGPILAHTPDFNHDVRKKYSAPFLDLHRVDLQRGLHEKALSLGVQFRLGERVTDIDFSTPRPSVTTKEGGVYSADLIVAADGLWSGLRARFLGKEEDPPKPTGDIAYRVVLHASELQDSSFLSTPSSSPRTHDSEADTDAESSDADADLLSMVRNPTVHFWIGPGAHAVGYSMRGGDLYNIVLLVPDDLPPGVRKQEGDVQEMRALFKEWDPVLGRFLEKVEGVEKWRLMHRDPLPTWIHPNHTFVFLGDACHPMLPYLAQGANSAIEDGAMLGLLLSPSNNRLYSQKSDLGNVLSVYEKLRKARGERIVAETWGQRESFHMPDGAAQEARDAIFLSQLGKEPQAPFPSRWTCPEAQAWLWGYDVFEEVEKVTKVEKVRGVL